VIDKTRTRPRPNEKHGGEVSEDDSEQDEVDCVYHHEIFDQLVAIASGNGAHHYGMRLIFLLLPRYRVLIRISERSPGSW